MTADSFDEDYGHKQFLFKKIAYDFKTYSIFVSELEKITNAWVDAVNKKDYELASEHALDLAVYHEDNKKLMRLMRDSFGKFEDLDDAEKLYLSHMANLSEPKLPKDMDGMKDALANLVTKALNLINEEAKVMDNFCDSDEAYPEYIFTTHYITSDHKKSENRDVMFA
jgi:hypothetical protein